MGLALCERNPPFQNDLIDGLIRRRRNKAQLRHRRRQLMEKILIGNPRRPDIHKMPHHRLLIFPNIGAQNLQTNRKGRRRKQRENIRPRYPFLPQLLEHAAQNLANVPNLCRSLGETDKHRNSGRLHLQIRTSILHTKMLHKNHGGNRVELHMKAPRFQRLDQVANMTADENKPGGV